MRKLVQQICHDGMLIILTRIAIRTFVGHGVFRASFARILENRRGPSTRETVRSNRRAATELRGGEQNKTPGYDHIVEASPEPL
jgi:hypothetical protein